MTIPDGVESVLVCGQHPVLARDRVVVTPASSASFDGDRWRCAFRITVVDRGEERTVTEAGYGAARREAARRIQTSRPAMVVLESRLVLDRAFPDDRGRRLERRLREAARRHDSTFLAWQRGPPADRDRRRYDLVLDRATDAAASIASRDRRRRRGSHTADTGR